MSTLRARRGHRTHEARRPRRSAPTAATRPQIRDSREVEVCGGRGLGPAAEPRSQRRRSTYASRCRSPRKRSCTVWRPAAPRAAHSSGSPNRVLSASPRPRTSVGSLEEDSVDHVGDLVLDPTHAEATTGRPFHIASVTVSPKPSTRLFCTTMVARRCSAFTRWRSRPRRPSAGTRWTRRLRPGSRRPLRPGTPPGPAAPSGSSVTPGDLRSDQHQVGRPPASAIAVDEALHDAGHVLEPVPSADLDHERAPRRALGRLRQQAARWRRTVPDPTVTPGELQRRVGGRCRHQPDPAQDRRAPRASLERSSWR